MVSTTPLNGITLEAVVTALYQHYDWPALAAIIPVRCFQQDPSISSSLKFLRRTPWARTKVEALYCQLVLSGQMEVAATTTSHKKSPL